MCVIYAIKNLVNNKIYIGSSKSPKARKYSHFHSLRTGKHSSPHLQKSYDKYGKDKFAFYILEECVDEFRWEREVFHIATHQSHLREYGYNIYEPDGKKFCCSDETKRKISSVRKNKISVDLYRLDGTFINNFDSIRLCLKHLGFGYTYASVFTDILCGKRKSYKGFTVVKKGEPFCYVPSSMQRNMTKFRK